jgi:diacylglycerol kinase (CTP)
MMALTSAAITSKVIKRLEGLTYLEMLGVSSIPEDDTEDIASSNVSDTEREKDLLFEIDDDAPEGEKVVLVVNENQVRRRRRASTPQPVVNGTAVNKEKKVDWEIPRKLLHSSIGQFFLPRPSRR